MSETSERRGARLSVNLNKVALLRNTRDLGIPSVERFACIALDAGADGITVHPRPDERHIRYDDVYMLNRLLAESPAELNIEGNPFHGRYLEVILETMPDQATLVPDEPGAPTSQAGWALDGATDRLEHVIRRLRDAGVRVSLFMEPHSRAMPAAAAVGADRIELRTEPYARAHAQGRGDESLAPYRHAADAARQAGLGVNAGHDLNLDNLPPLARAIPLDEVSIGHALTADALEMGFAAAVQAYRVALTGQDLRVGD